MFTISHQKQKKDDHSYHNKHAKTAKSHKFSRITPCYLREDTFTVYTRIELPLPDVFVQHVEVESLRRGEGLNTNQTFQLGEIAILPLRQSIGYGSCEQNQIKDSFIKTAMDG